MDAPSAQGFEPETPQASAPVEAPSIPEPTIINNHVKDEEMGNVYDGDVGPDWNGNQGHDAGMNHYNDSHVEEESRPIGIKEDG